MTAVSSQLPRERIIHWDDPRTLAEAGRAMNGRDFLDAILRGALPSPPTSHLVGITFERIDDGRVEMALMPQESQYNPIGRQTAMAEASLSDARGKLFAQASTTCLIFDMPD